MLLANSNAIMVYLVKRYAPTSDWLPGGSVTAAAVQHCLSIAADEVQYDPAMANEPCSGTCRMTRPLATEMQGVQAMLIEPTLVTGATSEIGRSIAVMLARAGLPITFLG